MYMDACRTLSIDVELRFDWKQGRAGTKVIWVVVVVVQESAVSRLEDVHGWQQILDRSWP